MIKRASSLFDKSLQTKFKNSRDIIPGLRIALDFPSLILHSYIQGGLDIKKGYPEVFCRGYAYFNTLSEAVEIGKRMSSFIELHTIDNYLRITTHFFLHQKKWFYELEAIISFDGLEIIITDTQQNMHR